MYITADLAWLLLWVLLIADLTAAAVLWGRRLLRRWEEALSAEVARCLLGDFSGYSLEQARAYARRHSDLFWRQYFSLRQRVAFPQAVERQVAQCLEEIGLTRRWLRQLFSRRRLLRMEAASFLAAVPGAAGAREALWAALEREKDAAVKVQIIGALAVHCRQEKEEESRLPRLLDALAGLPPWHLPRAYSLLAEAGEQLFPLLPAAFSRPEREVQGFIVYFASRFPRSETREHLFRLLEGEDEALAAEAARVLAQLYPREMLADAYLKHPRPAVRLAAMEAFSRLPAAEGIPSLLRLLGELPAELAKERERAVFLLTRQLQEAPRLAVRVAEAFRRAETAAGKQSLARALSSRVPYFALQLKSRERKAARELLRDLLVSGESSEIINFLNRNTDLEIENELLAAVREAAEKRPELRDVLCGHLEERLLAKLGWEKKILSLPRLPEKPDRRRQLTLYAVLAFAVLIFPGLYFWRHSDVAGVLPLTEQLKIYVLDFNYYLVYYAAAVNLIYLALLGFSALEVRKQGRLWRLKGEAVLFKERVLPSISIIAPAFNEEATIIESVNSLLNLSYPDYEVIVVNDGSRDRTLERLVEYFGLERVEMAVQERLRTMPVRGVYANPSLPRLLAVDKVNGGKADSLNAGINAARKEYFCGIDADSLLERDALLKLAAMALDTAAEGVAMGGNVLPVNGCRVEKGEIVLRRIPRGALPRFQTAEYLRAFMAGRLGWAYLNCLLIISGAFGLFKRQPVLEMGGYLTASERYEKDTVGEDMELVVRLSRFLRDKKHPHHVGYSFHANCWTEVPEKLGLLARQRDRWHRGLIDILTFHLPAVGNPRYGAVGLAGLPYFFLFEMLGPLVEAQGYVMVVLAAVWGLLNETVALLLFVSNVLMGTLISLASLLIAEQETRYFTGRENAVLVFYALLENFGFRQLVSFWRVSGFISSLKKSRGWGKMERRGFGGSGGGGA